MPGWIFHQTLTAQALTSNQIFDADELINNYCCYPDYYYDDRSAEVKPYMFFYDGIQFHYPPHTPVEEFYRYWDRDEKGNYPFNHYENENITHVEAGFRFYLEKVISLLNAGTKEEAWKYLGCLLHFLEDATFGVHALEGADGTDLFVLDRLSGTDTAKFLCSIELPEELKSVTVKPEIISAQTDELVSLLYSRYAKDSAFSRKLLFDMAVGHIYGTSHRSFDENVRLMFMTALQLTADAVASIMAIVSDRKCESNLRDLTDFTPFHYPIGGSGFILRKYEEAGNTVTFGVNSSASLLYRIPENVYDTFTVQVSGIDIKHVTLQVINRNEVVQTLEMESGKEFQLNISSPGGIFGFRISSSCISGQIRFSDGVFQGKEKG